MSAPSTDSVASSNPGGETGVVSDRSVSPTGESTSPASNQQLSVRTSPGGDGIPTSIVTPRNPFEQIPSVSTFASTGTGAVPAATETGSLSDQIVTPRSVADSSSTTYPSSPDRQSSIGPSSSNPPSPAQQVQPSLPAPTSISFQVPVLAATHLSPALSTTGPAITSAGEINTAPPQPQSTPSTHTTLGYRASVESQQPYPGSEHRNDTSAALHEPSHQQQPPHSAPHLQQPVFDDDENTEPSSAANTSQQTQKNDSSDLSGSFVRFLENTRRRLSTGRKDAMPESDHRDDRKDDDSSDEDDGVVDGALICGYLQKLGRNGKWQTRWFETDGECLSYYKSRKRSKLLATLDLEKVGMIEIDAQDDKGCSFSIQVLGRLYHLRASSRASCKDWVITLNRVKEARLQQGNVKLVNPVFDQPPRDLLDRNDDFVATRVVVVANRERTRAVAEPQDWDEFICNNEEDGNVELATSSPYDVTKRRSTIGNAVVARWTKRKSSLSRLSAKFARWARSLRKYSCAEIEADSIQLDRHVHPPGHDDKPKNRRRSSGRNDASNSTEGAFFHEEPPSNPSPRPRLPVSGAGVAKPGPAGRSMSVGSEEIRTIS